MEFSNGYRRVWYQFQTIANIVSLKNVQKTFRVAYDSDNRNHLMLHRPDKTNRAIRWTEEGLYVSQVLRKRNQMMLVRNVNEKKKSYTWREVRRAEAAQRLVVVVGRPSERRLCHVSSHRELHNSNVLNRTLSTSGVYLNLI